MQKLSLTSPVSMISGVGLTRQKQLNKLGICTVRDLIYHFPRAYEMRGDVHRLTSGIPNTDCSYILTVATKVTSTLIRKNLTISKFRAFDESGSCEIVFFNAPFVKDIFHVGCEFRFYGKLSISKKTLKLQNPKYEPIIPGIPLPSLVPIYHLTEGISSKFIEKIIRTALEDTISDFSDPLPDDIRLKNALPVLSYALRNIHFPESNDSLSKAVKRLAFDEMLCFGIGISLSKRFKTDKNGISFSPCDLKPLLEKLPYELTVSQKNTVNDIYRDTVIGAENGKIHPMARILVGDVGSGKTICAIIAMYIAIKSGYQASLMAPTEILARQHYKDICNLFDSLGIKAELLLGATTQKDKRRIYQGLQDGTVNAVVGTHALISDKVEFNRLGLVITDEQHRFGVAQRASLKDKASAAHMLVMSATPIPRTLALTLYGDLDVSRITEMPKGRMKVDTFVVNESYRKRLDGFIESQVKNGGQCYIVCPAIEKNEDEENAYVLNSITNTSFERNDFSNIKNAVEYAQNLRQRCPSLRIECLHGKMKPQEKDLIMQRFSAGDVDVLVSTTVIEVGVNVPNASLMVIENAERFGMSQLHQLRGRVGRGTRKSYCVLVSDHDTEKSKARLEILRTTYDGYEIAEKDLTLRGPGDFFASNGDEAMRQSGGFEFKLAKLCDDADLFSRAFAAAKAITDTDPELKAPENKGLLKLLSDYLTPSESTIS